MPKTRVLLCDDLESIRLLLRTELSFDPDVEIVGEATNGDEAIVLAEETQPDVIVLDLAMPVRDGLRALPGLRLASPKSRVIVLSHHRETEAGGEKRTLGASARSLGAADFLDKAMDLHEIARRVKASGE